MNETLNYIFRRLRITDNRMGRIAKILNGQNQKIGFLCLSGIVTCGLILHQDKRIRELENKVESLREVRVDEGESEMK